MQVMDILILNYLMFVICLFNLCMDCVDLMIDFGVVIFDWCDVLDEVLCDLNVQFKCVLSNFRCVVIKVFVVLVLLFLV